MTQPELSIVAPCYNEEENIESVVQEWAEFLKQQGLAGEIVVCNDGSRDRSGEILESLRQRYPFVVHVHNPTNGGYGHALRCAIAASSGRLVMTMDSDGQFDVAQYLTLRQTLDATGAQGVTGWRMGKKDTWLRVVADRIMNRMVRLLYGLKLRDTNCAQKLVQGDILRKLNLEAQGYPTPTEICVKLQHQGYKLAEAGVPHFDRRGGVSKLKFFQTGIRAAWFFVYLAFKIRLYKKGILNRI